MWDLYLFLHKTTVCVSGFSNEKKIITLSRLLCVSLLIVNIVLRKLPLKHKKNVYWIMKQPQSCWSIPINHVCHISWLYRSKKVTVPFSFMIFKWAVVTKKWIMSAMNWELPMLTSYVFIEKDVFLIYIPISTSYPILHDNKKR